MRINRIFVFALLSLFSISTIVKADIAAPQFTVQVTYNNAPVNGNLSGEMLFCSNTTSLNSTQFVEPWAANISQYDSTNKCYWIVNPDVRGGYCSDSICNFYYFPSGGAFKFAAHLDALNRTFITNATTSNGAYIGYSPNFNYQARLYPNGTATLSQVGNQLPPNPITPKDLEVFFVALILTVVIEVIVSYIYISIAKIKDKFRIPLTVAIANLISVPLLWFGFILFLGLWGFVIGEVFAVVFEGYVVYYFNKKAIKLGKAMIMSLIMNFTSLAVGFLILVFTGLF